jgi:hypothetical protein
MTRYPSARAFALLVAASASASAQSPARVPWTTGENLEYSMKLDGIPAGTARLQVLDPDTVRGRRVWRLHPFTINRPV